MNIDEKYMLMAIKLAKRAEGLTSPNPLVGAVVVRADKVVGKGYHKRRGLAHAEANALADARGAARGATLYVTLEPCDHYGMTPPCTDAIIRSGIRRVVVAMKDPNPITDSRGLKKLKRHGIETVLGTLRDSAEDLNKPFIKFMTEKMPYVTVKIAQSLDGKIATRTGDSRWITSEDSRAYVQSLRFKSDAVVVGVNTVINDDPMLLSRKAGSKQPVRVIVDSRLRIPIGAKVLSSADISPVIIVTTDRAKNRKASACLSKGAKVLYVKSRLGRVDLGDMLKKLGNMNLIDLLVEGGGELIAGLAGEGLVDRFLFFIAPILIGGRKAATSMEGAGVEHIKDALGLDIVKTKRFSRDMLIEAMPARTAGHRKRIL